MLQIFTILFKLISLSNDGPMSALIHSYILTYNTSGFVFTNASAEANSSSHFVDSVLITSKHSSQRDPLQNCLAILLTNDSHWLWRKSTQSRTESETRRVEGDGIHKKKTVNNPDWYFHQYKDQIGMQRMIICPI